MSYKNWRNQEVNDRLMESWGFKAPKSEVLTESVDAPEQELEEAHCGGVHEDEKELEEGVPSVKASELDDDDVLDGPGDMSVKDGKLVNVTNEAMIRKTIREAITKALKNREA